MGTKEIEKVSARNLKYFPKMVSGNFLTSEKLSNAEKKF